MYSASTGSTSCILVRTESATLVYTQSKASPGCPPTLPGVSPTISWTKSLIDGGLHQTRELCVAAGAKPADLPAARLLQIGITGTASTTGCAADIEMRVHLQRVTLASCR